MDIETLISNEFDEFYKINARYINIKKDLTINLSPYDVKNYLDKNRIYYKLSSNRYIKVKWIIDRMYDYLTNEGCYIDFSIAEEILRFTSQTRSINQKNLCRIFFSRAIIITENGLDRICKDIFESKEYGLKNNNVKYIEGNLTTRRKISVNLFDSEIFDSELQGYVIKSYNLFRIINRMNEADVISKIAKVAQSNDIRHLCFFCRYIAPDLTIQNLVDKIGYKRVGIHRIELLNEKNNNIKLDFEEALLELEKRIDSRGMECFYDYTIENKFTLEELGQRYNVTRERIRQIIRGTNNKIEKNKYLFQPFKDYLDQIFKYQDSISIDKLTNSYLIKFSKSEKRLERYFKILNNLFNKNYHIYNMNLYNFDTEDLRHRLKEIILCSNEVNYKIISKKDLYSFIRKLGFIDPIKIDEYLIGLLDDVIYSDTSENILIKNGKINNVDICRWILFNIGEPTHYNIIYEEYCNYIGNTDTSIRALHGTLDRSEEHGIVRTFVGTYGLVELGAKKHVFTKDLAISILEDFNRPMHYTEIIAETQKQSDVKDNTIYASLNNSSEILSNNEGVYALKIWEDRLDHTFQEKQEIDRKLIEHGYNKYNNYSIKYLINQSIFNDYLLRLPSNTPIKLASIVRIINTNNDEFLITYKDNYNYLYRIDRVLSLSNMRAGEYVYLELVSPEIIRIFKEEEYRKYINGELIFSDKEQFYDSEEEIDDLLSIFYKKVEE